MVIEVLRQTPCHKTPIKTYQMEVAGCVEHSAALLPDGSSNRASRTPPKECNQKEEAHQCTSIGPIGSLRIEPHHGQGHSREVKTIEGEKQQVRLLRTRTMLVRGVPDEEGTPGHFSCHEVQKMTKNEKQPTLTDQELPPLPDRALKGLKNPWVSPTGEPFHTVRLWEFENLYVLLKHGMWKRLAKHKIPHYIRTNPDQTIRVTKLKELCTSAKLNLDEVEQSVRAVRFNFCGKLEYLTFPFSMNIYAWRALCHILGDGNIHSHNRKYPELRWTQWPKRGEVRIEGIPPKKQRFMRNLLELLSRFPGGQGTEITYPKALAYTIMGTIPTLTLDNLKTPRFIDFILNLPKAYVDYKVQFLAAFTVDDGSVSGDISFHQKDPIILEKIMELCDQLGYDRSPSPSRQQRDGMYDFNLRLEGVRAFFNDLNDIQARNNWNPLLGLWHFNQTHENIVNNISEERLIQNKEAIIVCEGILTILSENKFCTTNQLSNHPKIYGIAKKYSYKVFRDRLKSLLDSDLIYEVKKPSAKPYRPKHWAVPPNSDTKALIRKFHSSHGNRSRPQSYERKFVTVEMTKVARARLRKKGINPTPTNTAREIGCSRQAFYRRPDLRKLFKDNGDELD